MIGTQGLIRDSQPGSHDLDNEAMKLLSRDSVVLLKRTQRRKRQTPHARRTFGVHIRTTRLLRVHRHFSDDRTGSEGAQPDRSAPGPAFMIDIGCWSL